MLCVGPLIPSSLFSSKFLSPNNLCVTRVRDHALHCVIMLNQLPLVSEYNLADLESFNCAFSLTRMSVACFPFSAPSPLAFSNVSGCPSTKH